MQMLALFRKINVQDLVYTVFSGDKLQSAIVQWIKANAEQYICIELLVESLILAYAIIF